MAGSTSTLTLAPTAGSTTFSGTIDGNSSGAISLVMSGTGTQVLAGSMTGPGSLTVNSGELILSGTNTYTGGTTVDAGTLAITTATALPDGTSLTVGAGGTFIFDPSLTGSPVRLAVWLPVVGGSRARHASALLAGGLAGLAAAGWRRRLNVIRGRRSVIRFPTPSP